VERRKWGRKDWLGICFGGKIRGERDGGDNFLRASMGLTLMKIRGNGRKVWDGVSEREK
jgi:hypothetical protein